MDRSRDETQTSISLASVAEATDARCAAYEMRIAAHKALMVSLADDLAGIADRTPEMRQALRRLSRMVRAGAA